MKQKKLLAAVLGGCLGFLAFPEINWTPLIAVAYIPYFWLINRCNGFKETFLYTWLYSAVMTLGGFFWLAHTVVTFGRLPWFVAILILLVYSAVGSINLAFTGGFAAILKKHISMKWQALWVTALFVVVETFFPKLFHWYAGNAIYQVIPLIQIADIGGPIFLTTQILIVNYALFALFDSFILPRLQKDKTSFQSIFSIKKEALTTIALGAGFLIFSFVYGHFRLQEIEKYQQKAVYKNIGIVQGNLGNAERLRAQFGDGATIKKFFDFHRDLTLTLADSLTEPLDLVLWPEGAYPYPFPDFYPTHREMAALTAKIQAPIVTGGYTRQRKPEYKIFNTMLLLEPGQTRTSGIYKKHILLAFGEYMPFADIFPILKELVPTVSTFGAGPGAEIMPYKDFVIAPLICYEALDADYMREYSQQNANIILNITNDSWYGRLQEPEQHLALSQLRCVESRKVQVRSTNTGISAIIWPNGEITHRTELDKTVTFAAKVPLMAMPPTFYSRYGDWWGGVMAVILVLMVVVNRKQVVNR